MTSLRRIRELDELATQWLRKHDPEVRERRAVERGPVVEWQLAPVEVLDDDEGDAGEIARTFADLSGGRLLPRFAAWTWILDDGSLLQRAEYMRRKRAEEPERAREWRALERAPRAAAREADRAARAVGDLFEGPHRVEAGMVARGEIRRAKDAARKRAARERNRVENAGETPALLRRIG